MHLQIDSSELEEVITKAVSLTIASLKESESKLGDVMAFDEPTAARLLSLEPHQLRDERLRGRIASTSIVGRRVRYTRADLMQYLNRNRSESRI